MKFPTFAIVLALSVATGAQAQKKPAPARPAAIARPTASPDGAKGRQPLIATEISARDMDFVRAALDLEKTTTYLAKEASQLEKKDLFGLCAGFVRTLESQGPVIATLAEMQTIAIVPVSIRQQQIEAQLSKLDGTQREKAMVEAFIETDNAVIAAYELAAKSSNPTIQALGEKVLPQAREHLILVQAMAGRGATPPAVGEGPKATEPPKPASRPAFRTGVPVPQKAQ